MGGIPIPPMCMGCIIGIMPCMPGIIMGIIPGIIPGIGIGIGIIPIMDMADIGIAGAIGPIPIDCMRSDFIASGFATGLSSGFVGSSSPHP